MNEKFWHFFKKVLLYSIAKWTAMLYNTDSKPIHHFQQILVKCNFSTYLSNAFSANTCQCIFKMHSAIMQSALANSIRNYKMQASIGNSISYCYILQLQKGIRNYKTQLPGLDFLLLQITWKTRLQCRWIGGKQLEPGGPRWIQVDPGGNRWVQVDPGWSRWMGGNQGVRF